MKYILWILASIGALTVAGSFYVNPDIEYQAIYWFLKIGFTLLGIILPIWIISGLINQEYYDRPHYHDQGDWKIFIRPIISLVILISAQYMIWGNNYSRDQINQLAITISSHIEFPGDGNAPRFYIGEKPSK